jgi:hypothetical protein
MARFASHIAREKFTCPRCGAVQDEYCTTPAGRVCTGVGGVHGDRMALLSEDDWDQCKARAYSIFDLLNAVEGD